jgi:hypothetical protein
MGGGASRRGGPAPLTLAPTEPAKRVRKPRRAREEWTPPPAAVEPCKRILAALADAREAAGWPRGWGPKSKLRRDLHAGLVERYQELLDDGEDAEALLCALMRAKVPEQAGRKGDTPDDAKARAGGYANAVTLCRPKWWAGNLATARAWLHRHRKTAPKLEPGIVVVDGQQLTAAELKIWERERPSGLALADRAVRWHRDEEKGNREREARRARAQ